MNTRAAFEKMLDQTCDIYRSSTTVNSSHEVVGTETLLAESVACFMAMPSGRKVVMPAGVDPAKTRLFYFKYDQDIQELDTIKFNGRKYVVNSCDVTPKNHHIEAMCETVLGG